MIGMLALLLALLARIHGDGAAPPTPAAAPPAGLLAGPAAAAPAAAPTIVERSFDGALAPLDDEPEVVAAFRLTLSDDQRPRLELLGQMAKRAIQRRADGRTAQFDAVVRQLDLTPEQAERVKQLFMEIAVQEIQGKRERGQLTRRERERVFGELATILDESQRGKLRELLLGDRGSADR